MSTLGFGEPCGALPLHPTRVIDPGPGCGSGWRTERAISRWSMQHADTDLEKKIEILRAGGGTATRTRAGRRVRRRPDALHPGKTIKRSGERIHSLNRSFFVFIAPVGTFPFLKFRAETSLFSVLPHRRMGAGGIPLPQGEGAAQAPSVPQASRRNSLFTHPTASRSGSRDDIPGLPRLFAPFDITHQNVVK